MYLKWVLGLFAATILISQSAMDFFSILLCLHVLWMGFRWHQQKSAHKIYHSVGIDWLFIVWFLVVFIGYAITGFAGEAWEVRLLDFKWVLLFYLTAAAVIYLRPTEKIVTAFAIVFGLCSLYAVVVWFLGFDPQRPEIPLSINADGSDRTGGFIEQPIIFAHIYQLPLMVLTAILMMMLHWKEKGRWIVALSVLLGAGGLLLSFTRGVWLSSVIAILVMTFLFSRKLATVVSLVMVGVGALLYTQWPNFHDRVHIALDGVDFIRVWIWRANWLMFTEHPIVGMGYDNNVEALPEYYARVGAPSGLIVSHAHNQYFHLLAGTGALGTACFLVLVFYFLILSIRTWRRISARESFHKGLSLGLIGAQIAFLVGGLTEANWEHAKIKCAMILIWSFCLWLAYEYRVLRD